MQEWESITAAVAAAMAVLLLAVFLVCYICCCTKSQHPNPGLPRHRRVINNTHTTNGISNTNTKVSNRRAQSQYSFSGEAFSWDNHPSLVTEALEHGWTTFAFTHNYFNTNKKTSSSARPWGMCAGAGAQPDDQAEPEITWEAVSGSNLMQKIRLNPCSASSKFTTLQTALPLPGPPLNGFPQESYLEIAIVSEATRADENAAPSAEIISDEDDRVKLLQLVNLDHSLGNAAQGPRLSNIIFKRRKIIALGQNSSGTFGRALPGLDSGSVGFYSSGAVVLNSMPVGAYSTGTILSNAGDQEDNIEEELRSWGGVGSVIGWGFDPATRCAYLTLNGARIRSVQCRSQEFGAPLYPTIAANYDVTVLVNFGQREFSYGAANSSRLSDPSCLNMSCLEDSSQEFFSMDRIDPLWLADRAVWPAKTTGEADDGDLFDIVLDGESL